MLLYVFIVTEQRTTNQGQVYYFHAQSGISTWHDPRVPRSGVTCILLAASVIQLCGFEQVRDLDVTGYVFCLVINDKNKSSCLFE